MAEQYNELSKPAQTALQTLRVVVQEVAAVLWQLRLDVARVNADPDLNQGAKTRREDELAQQAMQRLDALWQVAEQARGTLERWIAAQFARDGDVAAETLAELRLQRAWARLARRFDAVASDSAALLRVVQDVAGQAAAHGDTATLRALDEELPAYLDAHGLSVPPSLQLQLAELQAQYLSPAQREAKRLQLEITEGWARLVGAFGEARRSVAQRAFVPVLPGWGASERVFLPTESV